MHDTIMDVMCLCAYIYIHTHKHEYMDVYIWVCMYIQSQTVTNKTHRQTEANDSLLIEYLNFFFPLRHAKTGSSGDPIFDDRVKATYR
jgi:hypothetical protein